MRVLAVVSGKGGAGKTMVTAALADSASKVQVLADCDVEASNLGFLIPGERMSTEPFRSLDLAFIDPGSCVECGICVDNCAFGAILYDGGVHVEAMKCEGCGLCEWLCPHGAVTMTKRICGDIYRSETASGKMAHGRLNPGSGTSGLLVNEVKKRALLLDPAAETLLIDGPPGIGCALISTVSGCDAVLAVTEPSISAIHDLKRLLSVTRRFGLKFMLLINRHDLEPSLCEEIEAFSEREGIRVIAKIPFDSAVVDAVRNGLPITKVDCDAAKPFSTLWEVIDSEMRR